MKYTHPFHIDSEFFEKLGFFIDDPVLLQETFTHRSAINERSSLGHHNERLEFLGDAVLELVVTDLLFVQFPEKPEGDLTNLRSALVRGDHLAQVARRLDMGQYLLLSRGEARSGGAEKDYLLANLVEAFIGAIYLNKGLETARKFIEEYVWTDIGDIMKTGYYIDVKSAFQELVQEKIGLTPHYKLFSESGLDHDKTFVVDAYVGALAVGRGSGHSKKEAQTNAAQAAMDVQDKWLVKLAVSSL